MHDLAPVLREIVGQMFNLSHFYFASLAFFDSSIRFCCLEKAFMTLVALRLFRRNGTFRVLPPSKPELTMAE